MAEKIVLITGANSGLGYETACVLASRGAHVVMGCRNGEKAEAAMAGIRERVPEASLEFLDLDLADLDSVREAAHAARERHPRLDLLINNAGVMWLRPGRTADGFETHFGTNHLGHFAFTGLLLDTLLETPGARVVTLSSIGHLIGRIYFDDLWLERRRYGRQKAYSQSKLANLIFALDLQRRLHAAGAKVISVAAHPGVAGTNLATPAFEEAGRLRFAKWIQKLAPFVAGDPAKGARPTLYAATADDVKGGDYIGPGGFFELRGSPKKAFASRRARDPALAKRLWTLSEELTGIDYGPLRAA